ITFNNILWLFLGTPCYSNNLACHPSVGDMRSALKVKIQNAINSAILVESEDRGIFVGGRRRNRKKKRTKHVKTEKKKTKRSESGRGSPNMTEKNNKVVLQKSVEEDTKPLIESGFCDSIISLDDVLGLDLEEEEEEGIPPLVESGINFGPLVQYTYAVPNITDYIEQIESNDMPLFKKKQPQEDVEQLQEKSKEQGNANEESEERKVEIREDNSEQTKKPETEDVNQSEAKEKPDSSPQDGTVGGTSFPTEDGKATPANGEVKNQETTLEKTETVEKQTLVEDGITTKYENEVDGVVIETEQKTVAAVTEQPNGKQVSKESSPLITKEEEGTCLCCTIL
ncbi:uncharacterized protein LOC134238150, partial [Saccostrea cucullata]|uniref:uncharacterized protein LOC134238150 n=1 Tax=Saccostrea cuccullata TaxID=36930 RepID=UPI002ED25B98